MFAEDWETSNSRNSDRLSTCEPESDVQSWDSTITKEPLLFRVPHAPVSFSAGGRIIFMDPETSVTTVKIEDAKNYYLDSCNQRIIEALESFKGFF